MANSYDASAAAAQRLAAMADQVDDAARRLIATDCRSWSSLAADRYRARLGDLASDVRQVAEALREAASQAAELHRAALASDGPPLSWVIAVPDWR